MKFSERMRQFAVRLRSRFTLNCYKLNFVVRFLLWHTCWCSLVVGAVILAVGIVLRSKLIQTTNVQLVESSGLFFMVIGIFLLVLSPLIALYELTHLKRLDRIASTNGHLSEDNMEIHSSETLEQIDMHNDLPTYEEISKSSRVVPYPRMLDVDSLSNSSQTPMPPAYSDVASDITRTESMQSKVSYHPSEKSVATIAPSSHTETNADVLAKVQRGPA